MSVFSRSISTLLLCVSLGTFQSATGAESDRAPHVIAHRGGKVWAPENTMAAFKKCLENNVYGIELDIHRCKSGELVVIHDHDLKGTTDGDGLIKDLTYDELKKFSAGKWFSEEFAGERIPTLTEVLKLIDGKLVLNIEIKNSPISYDRIEDDLIAELKNYKHPETIIISSFDHEVLQRLHEKAPQYKLALLGYNIFANLPAYAKGVGATIWHPGFGEMRKDVVEKAHCNKFEVNVWTLNKPEQWQSAVNMDVDGIVTDDPIGLSKYLSSLAVKPKK